MRSLSHGPPIRRAIERSAAFGEEAICRFRCEMKKIYYTKPSITNLEIRYATDAVSNGWGERCYDYIYRLEDLFKRHLDVTHAIATSSCTGALQHRLGCAWDQAG